MTTTQTPTENRHWRFHQPHAHLEPTFGTGGFGVVAEKLARIFGTPQYLIAQTVVVILWIAGNAAGITHFDIYPFILLNLAFSTQAAYAAPLILLAETRQTERDKAWADADARHRQELSESTLTLLQQNTQLTQRIADLSEQLNQLTQEIHGRVVTPGA